MRSHVLVTTPLLLLAALPAQLTTSPRGFTSTAGEYSAALGVFDFTPLRYAHGAGVRITKVTLTFRQENGLLGTNGRYTLNQAAGQVTATTAFTAGPVNGDPVGIVMTYRTDGRFGYMRHSGDALQTYYVPPANDGIEIDTQGDAFFFVFPRARDAVSGAVEAQRAHAATTWPGEASVQSTAPVLRSSATNDGALGAGICTWLWSTPLPVITSSTSPAQVGEHVVRSCGRTPSLVIRSKVQTTSASPAPTISVVKVPSFSPSSKPRRTSSSGCLARMATPL